MVQGRGERGRGKEEKNNGGEGRKLYMRERERE